MCEAAPGIIDSWIAWASPSTGLPEGLLDYRRFGGTLYHRTAFAGATTGQQLLYALDEQVRRHESEGRVTKREGWTFLSAVIDDRGVGRGICAMDLRSMEVKTFAADAVIFATGGIGAIFGRSTNSVVCTGSAQSAFCSRAWITPTANLFRFIRRDSGRRQTAVMSESARGEGGRVWVPRNPSREASGEIDS